MNGGTVWTGADGKVRAGWQLVVFGLAVVVAAVGIGSLGFAIISPTPIVGWARQARIPLDQVVTAISLLVATRLTARLVGRDAEGWALVALSRASWSFRALGIGALLGVTVVALPTLLLWIVGAVRFVAVDATEPWGTTAWGAFALLAPAALSEELLFRGFVFSVARESIGVVRAVLLTSLFFGLAHVANPEPTVRSTIAVVVAGVLLATVRVATRSLGAAFAAHLAINYTQAALLHAPVSGLALATPGYRLVPVGADWLTGGSWGPEAGVAVIAAMAGAIVILQKTEERREKTAGKGEDRRQKEDRRQ